MKEMVASRMILFTITLAFGLLNSSNSQIVLLSKLSISIIQSSKSFTFRKLKLILLENRTLESLLTAVAFN